MPTSSPAVEPRRRSRAKKRKKCETAVTPDEWVALVARDEQRAVRLIGQGRDPGQGLLDYYDAANEDSEGRLPHEPGYCGRYQREVRALRAIVTTNSTTPATIPSEGEVDDMVRQLVMRFAEAA